MDFIKEKMQNFDDFMNQFDYIFDFQKFDNIYNWLPDSFKYGLT